MAPNGRQLGQQDYGTDCGLEGGTLVSDQRVIEAARQPLRFPRLQPDGGTFSGFYPL